MQQLADKADRKAGPLQLAVASHVVQTCQSSAVALREAQLGSLYLGKFLAERDRRVDADLQAFSADRGILHDALGHERALAAFEQDLQPVPQQACLECDVVPDIGSAVAKVCSASHAAKDIAGRSDSAALAASWNRRHNIVRHTEAQAIPDEDQEAKWKCWRFGCCICCADGKRLYRVRNAVLRAMKRAFPSKSDRRQLQAQGAIFIALRSQAPGGDGPVDLVDGDNLLIFHIGLQYFKPYRPTYQEMIVMEKGMNGEWRLQVAALWGYMRVSKLCVKSWMCEANFEALGRQVEEWVAHGFRVVCPSCPPLASEMPCPGNRHQTPLGKPPPDINATQHEWVCQSTRYSLWFGTVGSTFGQHMSNIVCWVRLLIVQWSLGLAGEVLLPPRMQGDGQSVERPRLVLPLLRAAGEAQADRAHRPTIRVSEGSR